MEKTQNGTPLILEIKGNSLDDGPGIRTVVFFKGCPLSCVWCHNPESRKAVPEIAFDGKLCVDCGECRKTCPEKALSKSNPFYIDRNRCSLCFICTGVCPSGALEQVGKTMTVSDIIKKVLPDKPFYISSGGGVTLSGGEATLYMDFASALSKELKKNEIHTLLETCGSFDLRMFMDLLYPHLDMIYYDIKIMDNEQHKKYCRLSNERILSNLKELSAITKKDGKFLLPRTPLIPGMTDSEDNIRAVGEFLLKLGITEAALLPYNPFWHEKNAKVGLDDPYRNDKAMNRFILKDELERLRSVYRNMGIKLSD